MQHDLAWSTALGGNTLFVEPGTCASSDVLHYLTGLLAGTAACSSKPMIMWDARSLCLQGAQVALAACMGIRTGLPL